MLERFHRSVHRKTPVRVKPASGNSKESGFRTHLLVVSGKRPAILASTIWALAHESPPAIPDRVTVVTTVVGREAIRRELFTPPGAGKPCVWEGLRSALAAEGHDLAGRLVFGDTGEDVRVITAPDASDRSQELDDLHTSSHYEFAGDFLLDVIRTLTEVDNTRLIASVSGGRKPLVSLLAGALAFLGRPQDRLVHALINDPFDSPSLRPPLYFPPQPPIQYRFFDPKAGVERTISSSSARLTLAEIPFVRLRLLFAKEPQLYRSRYSVLARAYSNRLSELSSPIELAFDDATGMLSVNGQPIELRGREHPFFAFIFDRWQRGEAPFASQKSAEEPLRRFLLSWQQRHLEFNLERDGQDWSRNASTGDVARMLSALRTRLEELGLTTAAGRLFPRSGPAGLPLSPEIVPPPIGS